MKKKMVFGVAFFALLVLQAQTVFANPRQNERLIAAVLKGDLAGARTALQRGADANARALGVYTALYYAVGSDNLEMVSLLLDRGANINLASDGTTPIYTAAAHDNLEMVRFLLDRGADIKHGLLLGGGTILNLDMVKFLVEHGADINNRFGYNGNTVLHYAVLSNRLDLVRYLVESGININARNNFGETAASKAYDEGEMEIYDYLKANGARDFEPRQVAQPAAPAPANTTVYVQPSAPVQSAPAPAPSTPTLRPGRYACSGTNVTIEIQSPLLFVTLYSGYTTVGNGTYRINGNTITITITQANDVIKHMRGITYAYTIVSDTSFSGSGETWYRR